MDLDPPPCALVTISCNMHSGVYLTLGSYSGFNIASCTHTVCLHLQQVESSLKYKLAEISPCFWTKGASHLPLLLCVYASRSAGFDGDLGNTKLHGSSENCFSCGVMQEHPVIPAFSWRHSFTVIRSSQSLSSSRKNI